MRDSTGDGSRTTRREHSAMDILQEAAICQIQSANDIASDDLLLVVFTPINVGPPCASCAVENMRWFDSLKLVHHRFPVLHAHSCSGDIFSSLLQDFLQVASNPPFATPNEENVLQGIHFR